MGLLYTASQGNAIIARSLEALIVDDEEYSDTH